MAPQSTAVRGGVVALAVHKPRGHASERIGAGDGADLRDAMGRPSVYGLVPRDLRRPSLTAVGRLDVETSGLIMFTDSAGLSAAIRGGRRVQKAYVATVSGAGLSDGDLARAAESMRAPLSRTDRPEEGEQDGYAWTSPAKVRVTRRWRLQEDDGAEDGAERIPYELPVAAATLLLGAAAPRPRFPVRQHGPPNAAHPRARGRRVRRVHLICPQLCRAGLLKRALHPHSQPGVAQGEVRVLHHRLQGALPEA